MSTIDDTSPLSRSAPEVDQLTAQIESEMSVSGVRVLTGNQLGLSAQDQALVSGIAQDAARMGISTPVLFTYSDSSAGNEWPFSSVLRNGIHIIGISEALKTAAESKLFEDNSEVVFTTSPVDRVLALLAHEEGHIKRNDMRHDTFPPEGIKAIRAELSADRIGMRATCNPKAFEDALNMLILIAEKQEGNTLHQQLLNSDAALEAGTPLLPTRIAHAEYMKSHLPRSCRKK